MILRRSVYLLSVLLWAAPAFSQTVQPCADPCVLIAGKPFVIQTTHDGKDTVAYRIYLDGQKFGTDLSLNALTAGTVTVTGLIAPARGAHTLELAAVNRATNPDEEKEARSPVFNFTSVMATPTAPGPLKILITVTVAENGTLQFTVTSVGDQ